MGWRVFHVRDRGRRMSLCRIILPGVAVAAGRAADPAAARELIESVVAIRRLSTADVAINVPARVCGFFAFKGNDRVIQDGARRMSLFRQRAR